MLKLLFSSILCLLLITPSMSKTRYEGQYAQLTQPQKEFIKKHSSCCDVSDGTFAEESWRPDGMYVSFTAIQFGNDNSPQGTVLVDWIKVPSSAVINEPNPFGRAVVWYYSDNDGYHVRCYVPGPGI